MKSSLSDKIHLLHYFECINDGKKMMDGIDEASFYNNMEKKYALLEYLEIISEALNALSIEVIRLSERTVSLNEIKGFRNIIVHEYFRVDFTQIYYIVTKEIKELKKLLQN